MVNRVRRSLRDIPRLDLRRFKDFSSHFDGFYATMLLIFIESADYFNFLLLNIARNYRQQFSYSFCRLYEYWNCVVLKDKLFSPIPVII